MADAQMQEYEWEFKSLLMPYTQHSGVTKDRVDAELAETEGRMANLHTENRHNTPDDKALQRKITDFKRLVELRGLIVQSHAPDTNL